MLFNLHATGKAVLVNLSPEETVTLLADFAKRFHQAQLNGEEFSAEQLAEAYYNLHVNTLLHETDPDRFFFNN